MTDFPPGVVGVIAQDQARFTMFAASLTSLAVPPGTGVKWIIGHAVAAGTNQLVESLYDEYPEAEWLWIMGDDHVFDPSLLMRLLAHDKDIVVPLCLTRFPPYKPVVFTHFAAPDEIPDGMAPGNYRKRLVLTDQSGVIPVHSAGTAGMLVRKRVFDTLSDPWFESGKVSSVEVGEDVYFCDKARAAGFEVYCDVDAALGHCTTGIVWPVRQPDGWTYGFTMMGGLRLTLPVGSWDSADEAA